MQQRPLKAAGAIAGDHGGVVIIGEDVLEAAEGGGFEHWLGSLDFYSIFLMLDAVQVTWDDGD